MSRAAAARRRRQRGDGESRRRRASRRSASMSRRAPSAREFGVARAGETTTRRRRRAASACAPSSWRRGRRARGQLVARLRRSGAAVGVDRRRREPTGERGCRAGDVRYDHAGAATAAGSRSVDAPGADAADERRGVVARGDVPLGVDGDSDDHRAPVGEVADDGDARPSLTQTLLASPEPSAAASAAGAGSFAADADVSRAKVMARAAAAATRARAMPVTPRRRCAASKRWREGAERSATASRGGAPAELVAPSAGPTRSVTSLDAARLPGGRAPRGGFLWPTLGDFATSTQDFTASAAITMAESGKDVAPGSPLWGGLRSLVSVAPGLAADLKAPPARRQRRHDDERAAWWRARDVVADGRGAWRGGRARLDESAAGASATTAAPATSGPARRDGRASNRPPLTLANVAPDAARLPAATSLQAGTSSPATRAAAPTRPVRRRARSSWRVRSCASSRVRATPPNPRRRRSRASSRSRSRWSPAAPRVKPRPR